MVGHRDRLWLSKIATNVATTLSFWPSRHPRKGKEVGRAVSSTFAQSSSASTPPAAVAGRERAPLLPAPPSTIALTGLSAGLPVVSSPNPPPPVGRDETLDSDIGAGFPALPSSATRPPNPFNNMNAPYDDKDASLVSVQSDPTSPVSVQSVPISPSISSGPSVNHNDYRHLAEVQLQTWQTFQDCLVMVHGSPTVHDFICNASSQPELPLPPAMNDFQGVLPRGAIGPPQETRFSPSLISFPQSASAGFPQAGPAGVPQAASNGFPHTGFPQSSSNGFPQAVSTGFPQAVSTGFPQAVSTGFPQAGSAMFSQATSNGFPHTGFPQSSAGFPQAGSAGFPQANSSGFSQAASNGFPQTLLRYPQAAVGIPQGGQIITRPPVGTTQLAAGAHLSSALPPFLTPQ